MRAISADRRLRAALIAMVGMLAVFGLSIEMPGTAQALELKPYKDRLFSYPRVLESRDGGDYRTFDYREMRDINGRDAIPEKRVGRGYVDLSPRRTQQDLAIVTPAGQLRFILVGDLKSARIVTVYIHGRGGNRTQGASDYTFGGNFNRIKNLMVRDHGVYVTPDAGTFADADMVKIRTLLDYLLRESDQASLVLACGSAGGAVCHHFSHEQAIVWRMAGIMMLGSFPEDGFFRSAAHAAKVPMLIAHGGSDPIIPVGSMEAFYSRLHGEGYPVRMVRFETGTHGTPIRMVDWRQSINWMLSIR